MEIRPENDGDSYGIRGAVEAAFSTPAAADLIDRLRSDGLLYVSQVAEEYGEVVANICFAEVEIVSTTDDASLHCAVLATLAVAPTHQGHGLGSELVRQGIEQCKDTGLDAIIVVGPDQYFSRFGFDAYDAQNIESPFSGPNFMILPLKQAHFDKFHGKVIYPNAFNL